MSITCILTCKFRSNSSLSWNIAPATPEYIPWPISPANWLFLYTYIIILSHYRACDHWRKGVIYDRLIFITEIIITWKTVFILRWGPELPKSCSFIMPHSYQCPDSRLAQDHSQAQWYLVACVLLLQTTFWNAFLLMKMFEFRLKRRLSLLSVQSTISLYWSRQRLGV